MNVFTLFCGECILKSEHGSTTQHWKIFFELEVIDFSDEKYEKAIELFMTKKQDGTEWKRTRRPAGHKYPSNRKTTKKKVTETSQASALCELVESSDEEATNYADEDNIPLSNISLSNYNSSDD